jgi:hypothetical protein
MYIFSCCPNLLMSQWFSKKHLVKKTNQKNPFKMVKSKSTCPKCQVGHGGKKTIWGVFFTKIPGKKNQDFL